MPNDAQKQRQQNCRKFRQRLGRNLRRKGFGRMHKKALRERLVKARLWKQGYSSGVDRKGETIYNRGIGSKKSAYSIFVAPWPWQDGKAEGVQAYYCNPDSGPNAPVRKRDWSSGQEGAVLPGQEYMIRKVYKGDGDPVAFADEVTENILYFEKLKPDTEYRMDLHCHAKNMPAGFTGERNFYDDGQSSIVNLFLVNLALANDGFAYTPHNSMLTSAQSEALNIIAEAMGMVFLPGSEITFPLDTPNGPHVLCMFANDMAADETRFLAFNGRHRRGKTRLGGNRYNEAKSDFRMPPFNDSLPLPYLLPLLRQRLSNIGELFMAMAHPYNVYKSNRTITDVGMISAAGQNKSGIGLYELLQLVRHFDAVEAWNVSMGNRRPIPRMEKLNEFVDQVMAHYENPGIHRTPNSFAQALVNFLNFEKHAYMDGKEIYGLFGTDGHCTPPMNYLIDGVPQAQGFTVLDLANVYAGLSAKPTAAEIVPWLISKRIGMHARVFIEEQDNYQQVVWGRRERYPKTQSAMQRMGKRGTQEYIRAILADAATLKLTKGKARNLARDFGLFD